MPHHIQDVAAAAPLPVLTISPAKVCFVVVKARKCHTMDETTESDPGSNSTDDLGVTVLEEHGDDPVAEGLTSFINALSEHERIDLLALAWLGRDGAGASYWLEARREAARAHNEQIASYLLGMPMLADFLEEGLSMLGLSYAKFEIRRL